MGYSLLQIPDLIILVSQNTKKYFGKRKNSVTNTLSRPSEMKVNEPWNVDEFSHEIRGEIEALKVKMEIIERHYLSK